MIPSAGRFGSLSGVAFSVLLVAALTLEGTPPAADAATADVVRYYTDNGGRLVLGTLVSGLAAVVLLWFGATLFVTIRSVHPESGSGTIALAGITTAAVGHTALFGFVFAAAATAGDVPPGVTQTLSVLAALFILPLAIGMAAAMIATTVAILSHEVWPRWLGYATIVATAAATISIAFGPSVAVVGWVITSILWVPLVSVVDIRERHRGTTLRGSGRLSRIVGHRSPRGVGGSR